MSSATPDKVDVIVDSIGVYLVPVFATSNC